MSEPTSPSSPPLPPGHLPPEEEAGSQALSEALKSSFFIVKIIMVVLVVAFLSSGFFTVGPQEKAILLRLGRPVGEGEKALLLPGPHWAFPPPIDSIERIPFTSVQVADSSVGWMLSPEERALNTPIPSTGPPSLDPATTTYAITADTNIIYVAATMRYHITDPIRFHFDFSNATVFVTNDLNNALLYATTRFSVDDALTRNPGAWKEAVKDRVTELTQAHGLGIEVDSIDPVAAPPPFLSAKFNEVVAASQEAKTTRTQAQSYETTKLAEARGAAATRLNLAEAERSGTVKMVEAQAKEFADVRNLYEHNPELFKSIRQMTTLEQVYSNAQVKLLEPHLPGQVRQLRLNLSRAPRQSSTNSAAP